MMVPLCFLSLSLPTHQVQLTCYVGAGEGRDTESLIGGEPDKQYGGCDTRLSEDDWWVHCKTGEPYMSPILLISIVGCSSIVLSSSLSWSHLSFTCSDVKR